MKMEEATIIAIVAIIVIVLIVIGIITILYWCFHKSKKKASNKLHGIEEGNGGQFLPQKELTNHKKSVHNINVGGNSGRPKSLHTVQCTVL